MLPKRKGFLARTVAEVSDVPTHVRDSVSAVGNSLAEAYSRLERVTGWRGRNDFDVSYQMMARTGHNLKIIVTWTPR